MGYFDIWINECTLVLHVLVFVARPHKNNYQYMYQQNPNCLYTCMSFWIWIYLQFTHLPIKGLKWATRRLYNHKVNKHYQYSQQT